MKIRLTRIPLFIFILVSIIVLIVFAYNMLTEENRLQSYNISPSREMPKKVEQIAEKTVQKRTSARKPAKAEKDINKETIDPKQKDQQRTLTIPQEEMIKEITELKDEIAFISSQIAEEQEEKDEVIIKLKNKIESISNQLNKELLIMGYLKPIFYILIGLVLFLNIIFILVIVYLNHFRTKKKKGEFTDISSNERPTEKTTQYYPRFNETLYKHERSINDLYKELEKTRERSLTNLNIDNLKKGIEQELKKSVEEKIRGEIDSMRIARPTNTKILLIEEYNRVLISKNKKKQDAFISTRFAKRAIPKGELAEKGYMATKGAEYIFQEHPGGSFLIVENAGEYLALPDFNIDIEVRYVSSAFNFRLSEFQGSKNWQLISPAKVEKTSMEREWRLTETGEIGGRTSLDYHLKTVENTKKEIDSINKEINSLKREMIKQETQRVVLEEEDVEKLFFSLLKKLRISGDFSKFLKDKFDEFIKKYKREATKIKVKKEESHLENEGLSIKVKEIENKKERVLLEVVLYNESLLSDLFTQKEFIERRKAFSVNAEKKNNILIYSAEKRGALFLIKGKIPDEHFVFPNFNVKPNSVTSSFTVISKGLKAWQIKKPAICKKISKNEWELFEKGEIII